MTAIRNARVPDDNWIEGLEEAALVELARDHDEAALRLIVRRNNQRLFRVARAVVRNDAEAEDVVQETYVKAFTNLATFKGESQLSTWLTRIALNEALGRVRRRRPTTGLDQIDAENNRAGGSVLPFPTSLSMPDPETEASRYEVRRVLERAVDDLPGDFRAVFVLRDIEDMTTEETAQHLGIKSETVKTRLHRARRLLRKAIETEFTGAFAGLFPFDGVRCTNMADHVIARVRGRPN